MVVFSEFSPVGLLGRSGTLVVAADGAVELLADVAALTGFVVEGANAEVAVEGSAFNGACVSQGFGLGLLEEDICSVEMCNESSTVTI